MNLPDFSLFIMVFLSDMGCPNTASTATQFRDFGANARRNSIRAALVHGERSINSG